MCAWIPLLLFVVSPKNRTKFFDPLKQLICCATDSPAQLCSQKEKVLFLWDIDRGASILDQARAEKLLLTHNALADQTHACKPWTQTLLLWRKVWMWSKNTLFQVETILYRTWSKTMFSFNMLKRSKLFKSYGCHTTETKKKMDWRKINGRVQVYCWRFDVFPTPKWCRLNTTNVAENLFSGRL